VRFDSIRGVRIIRAHYPLFASTATCRAVIQRSTSNSPSFFAHFARLTRRANCHSSRCGRQAYEILRWVIYIKTLPSCQSCQFSTTHLRLRSQPSCGRRHKSLSFPLHPHKVSLPTFALHASTSDTSSSSHLIPNPVRHFFILHHVDFHIITLRSLGPCTLTTFRVSILLSNCCYTFNTNLTARNSTTLNGSEVHFLSPLLLGSLHRTNRNYSTTARTTISCVP
jgi:hypothetical protein